MSPRGWLVYNLTNSPLYLGLVAFARAVPLLVLPLIGGVIADRVPRIRLLKITQTISLTLALVLGVLVTTGLVRVWEIIALSFLSGVVSSFDQPTQQALLHPNLVSSAALALARLRCTQRPGRARRCSGRRSRAQRSRLSAFDWRLTTINAASYL